MKCITFKWKKPVSSAPQRSSPGPYEKHTGINGESSPVWTQGDSAARNGSGSPKSIQRFTTISTWKKSTSIFSGARQAGSKVYGEKINKQRCLGKLWRRKTLRRFPCSMFKQVIKQTTQKRIASPLQQTDGPMARPESRDNRREHPSTYGNLVS